MRRKYLAQKYFNGQPATVQGAQLKPRKRSKLVGCLTILVLVVIVVIILQAVKGLDFGPPAASPRSSARPVSGSSMSTVEKPPTISIGEVGRVWCYDAKNVVAGLTREHYDAYLDAVRLKDDYGIADAAPGLIILSAGTRVKKLDTSWDGVATSRGLDGENAGAKAYICYEWVVR